MQVVSKTLAWRDANPSVLGWFNKKALRSQGTAKAYRATPKNLDYYFYRAVGWTRVVWRKVSVRVQASCAAWRS